MHVPSAITSNHGSMNRLLWIPRRKHNFSPGRVSSKAENNNAIQSVQSISWDKDQWEQSFVNTQLVILNCAC